MNINQCIPSKKKYLKLRKGKNCINQGLRNYIPGRKLMNEATSSLSSLSTEQLRKFSTPRIISTSSSTKTSDSSERTPQSSSNNTYVIVALCEGRGEAREEIGMSAIDIRRPELIIYQVSDTQGYEKTMATINMLNPIEILVPLTIYESRLVDILKKRFKFVSIHSIARRLFDANLGLQFVQHLCAKVYLNTLINIQHKYYALAATSALMNHLENSKCVSFASKSLKITYFRIENVTAIDCDTAYRLELVTTIQGSNKYGSLLGILNRCITNAGRRLLRANILQPLCTQKEIEKRLESVDELRHSPEILKSLQFILSQFTNVDCILALSIKSPEIEKCRFVDMHINYILLLKTILSAIPTLIETIYDMRSPQFNEVMQDLSKINYQHINEVILRIIQKDAVPCKGYMGEMQRCFSVKHGINQYLDIIRQKYSNLIEKAQTLIEKDLSQKHNLQLKLNYNVTKSFYIMLKVSPHERKIKPTDLPNEFINVTKHSNSFTMTTIKLVHLNRRIKDLQTEIELLSARQINLVLDEIREEVGSLYRLCECVAELDLIQSLAEIAKIPNYIKPEFSSNYLEVKSSKHPMLEFLMEDAPVSNDIFSSIDNNFNIITGPNMSGKSIYIKQIALLHIMAQIGSFVPACKACFRITDRIFTRINFDDCIECDVSTFQLEILEMKSIIDSLTPNSLVIIDELCRGTTQDLGIAFAWALCEQFVNTTAFVFVATHYITLTKLEDLYFNVINWHLDSQERQVNNEIRLSHTYQLLSGVTKIEKYGIAVARASAIPKSVVDRALEIVEQLLPLVKPQVSIKEKNMMNRVKYNFVTKIKYLKFTNELNNNVLIHLMDDFKSMLQKFEDNIFEEHNNYFAKAEIPIDQPEKVNTNDKNKTNIIKQIFNTRNKSLETRNSRNLTNEKVQNSVIRNSNQLYENENILTNSDQTSSTSYHYYLPASVVYSDIETSTSTEIPNVFNQNYNNIYENHIESGGFLPDDQNLENNNIHRNMEENVQLTSKQNIENINNSDYKITVQLQHFQEKLDNKLSIPSTSFGSRSKQEQNLSKSKQFNSINTNKNEIENSIKRKNNIETFTNEENSKIISISAHKQCNHNNHKKSIKKITNKRDQHSNKKRFLCRSSSDSAMSFKTFINVNNKEKSKSNPNLRKLNELCLNKHDPISNTSTSVSLIEETLDSTLQYKIQAKRSEQQYKSVLHLLSDENNKRYNKYLNSIEPYTPTAEQLSFKYMLRRE